MRFLLYAVAVSWLFGLASSVPRTLSQPEPSMPVTFVMKDGLYYDHGYLNVYNPDGSIAYRFLKSTTDPRRGLSTTWLYNGYGQNQFTLQSTDDTCNSKSRYEDVFYPSGSIKFKIDPRGMKADRWFIEIKTPDGKITYRLDRNYWDKGGSIYDQRGNKVAELKHQNRYDSWLGSQKDPVATYTLHATLDAPRAELVTLMALVLVRVDVCHL